MKAIIFAVVLIATYFTFASAQISASYGQQLAVNATAVTYSFGVLSPVTLTVSSSKASASSYVIVSSYTTLPGLNYSSNSGVYYNGGLPGGYINFAAGLTGVLGAGLYVNVSSDIAGSANIYLSFGGTVVAASGLASGNLSLFSPLNFNAAANVYVPIPPQQYNISLTGITIYSTQSIYVVLAIKTYLPINVALTYNPYYINLIANATTSFTVATAGYATLTIANLTAAAGTFAISFSNNTVNELNTAAGNFLISPIYSFAHSAGSNAQVSATFMFSITGFNNTIQENAAWYVYINGNWVYQQGSSSSSGSVTYTTNHFSDWSVQSSSSSSHSGASTLTSFFTLLKALF